MAIVNTDYMGSPVIGYKEYWAETDEERNTITPYNGDRCIMSNGDLYFCFDKNSGWKKIGGE